MADREFGGHFFYFFCPLFINTHTTKTYHWIRITQNTKREKRESGVRENEQDSTLNKSLKTFMFDVVYVDRERERCG